MRTYRFHAPEAFAELFRIVQECGRNAEVRFLAGGTDLVPRISRERNTVPAGEKPPAVIVSLAKLALDRIEERDGDLSIGAAATLTRVMENPLVRGEIPVLAQAMEAMAGFAVRNAATLGGNIMNASPAADSLPPLLALDASFVLLGPGGERRVEAGRFFTGPGQTVAARDEVLTRVVVRPGPGRANFQKIGRRAAESLSVVNAAAYVEQEGGICKTVRLAVGSAAPTVRLCHDAANALAGKPLTPETVAAAAGLVVGSISPITDIRASEWYRKRVAPVAAARAIMAAAGLETERAVK